MRGWAIALLRVRKRRALQRATILAMALLLPLAVGCESPSLRSSTPPTRVGEPTEIQIGSATLKFKGDDDCPFGALITQASRPNTGVVTFARLCWNRSSTGQPSTHYGVAVEHLIANPNAENFHVIPIQDVAKLYPMSPTVPFEYPSPYCITKFRQGDDLGTEVSLGSAKYLAFTRTSNPSETDRDCPEPETCRAWRPSTVIDTERCIAPNEPTAPCKIIEQYIICNVNTRYDTYVVNNVVLIRVDRLNKSSWSRQFCDWEEMQSDLARGVGRQVDHFAESETCLEQILSRTEMFK